MQLPGTSERSFIASIAGWVRQNLMASTSYQPQGKLAAQQEKHFIRFHFHFY
jgi:hypothetical protein